MATNAGAELSELDRFRAAVLSDVALQEALHTYDDQEGFVARALEIAGQHGINLIARDLEPALRYDPLGLGTLDRRIHNRQLAANRLAADTYNVAARAILCRLGLFRPTPTDRTIL